ncbi:MAG: hypothetical protein ACMXYE_05550 [Candidatus Woesearchaeota archaeon]
MVKHIQYLFDHVGSDEEVVRWIRTFGSYDNVFAVLKVSGASLEKYADKLATDIAILSRLDLPIPVVYGWGDAFSRKLADNGIHSEKHAETGVRITKLEDLPFLEEIAHEHGAELAHRLNDKGTHAGILHRVFSAYKKDLSGVDEHYTGDVTVVDLGDLELFLDNGVVPLIPPVGYTSAGQLMNINGDTASRSLVHALNPRRYIMITNTGGILDRDGNIIPSISIQNDYERLVADGVVSGGMKVKLDEVSNSIMDRPELCVQIAHPENLLKELFTDKGMGTFIRY